MLFYATSTFNSVIINYARWRWAFGPTQAGIVFGVIGVVTGVMSPVYFTVFSSSASVVKASAVFLLIGHTLAALSNCESFPLIIMACVTLALGNPWQPGT